MQRVVTSMPLAELWSDSDPVDALRGRGVTAVDIRALLQAGRVRFVVADIAAPLRWVPEADCFTFWKAEVQPHLADVTGSSLDDFPDGYCYFAAEWVASGGSPIVVLERHH
jgi:hypothetical protein